jgi:hypothetical protein
MNWRVPVRNMSLAILGLTSHLGAVSVGLPPPPPPPPPPPGPPNTVIISNQSGSAISSYPLQIGRPFVKGVIPHAPQMLVNGIPIPTQADVRNRYPDGSVEFAVLSGVLSSLPASIAPQTVTFQDSTANSNIPLPVAVKQMEALLPVGAAVMTLTAPTTGALEGSADAGQMLLDGNCSVWLLGSISTQLECADDSAARKYDIGFGDGFHPFRPRFYVTFWLGTNQVLVRAVGEAVLSTEIEDAKYDLTLTSGGVVQYSADLTGTAAINPKSHWAFSRWSRSFWIGGAPPLQVNIDNNLAYLSSTRFLPNYDTSIVPSQVNIATEYSRYTQNKNDIYDGLWNQPSNSTTWTSTMAATGARQEIAPYPEWTTLWLYTGDWRMRQVSLGLADQAASWNMHIREGNPTKRFLLTDLVGSGTGLGKPLARVDHQSMFIGLPFTWGTSADNLVEVGNVDVGNPWPGDGAHLPQPFYPQYILTGDPFYLAEMEFWDSANSFTCWGGSPNNQQGCGPYPTSSVYAGAVHSQLRGNGWIGRFYAETAFAEPDATPEKTYFTALTREMLERWEGGLFITGTSYDGTLEKLWGSKVGNDQSLNAPSAVGAMPPALHNWESNCNPTTQTPNSGCEDNNTYGPLVGTYTAPWMQWYDMYALGRIAELGYAAQAVQLSLGQYPVNMINNSGIPQMVSLYESPVEIASSSFQGWISGNTLTVTSINSTVVTPPPPITVGENVTEYSASPGACSPANNPACPVTFGTTITAQGTGIGGVGTYTVNNSQTVGSAVAPVALLSGGFFSTWTALENAFSPGFLTGTGAWASASNAIPAYFLANLASDGREVWLTPGLAMLVDEGEPNVGAAWNWWLANVYSKVPDFANDPKWAIIPRTDTNILPSQP